MNLIFLFIIFIFFLTAAFAGLSFAPWVPAWKKDLPRIFKLADLKPGQVFYELGCGDGRLVFYASNVCQAKAIGLEISLPMLLICKLRQLYRRDKNVTFKYKNLFKQNLSDADVVYFFGMPDKISKKLKKKLVKELKPGTKVISYAFAINGWNPEAISRPGPVDIAIYSYIMGKTGDLTGT